MILLQLLAAQMASIERLVIHTGDTQSLAMVIDALERLDTLSASLSRDDILAQIHGMGFQWGVSDGN